MLTIGHIDSGNVNVREDCFAVRGAISLGIVVRRPRNCSIIINFWLAAIAGKNERKPEYTSPSRSSVSLRFAAHPKCSLSYWRLLLCQTLLDLLQQHRLPWPAGHCSAHQPYLEEDFGSFRSRESWKLRKMGQEVMQLPGLLRSPRNTRAPTSY